MKKSTVRTTGASILAASLVLGGALAASAVPPAPDAGPVGGGTTVTVTAPAGVTFTQVSAGANVSLALGDDGHAYGWGANVAGGIGNDTTVDSSAPTRVTTPTEVAFTKVSTGYAHSLALDDKGNVWAWGHNALGVLGIPPGPILLTVPTKVDAGAVSFTDVAAIGWTSAALGTDGKVYVWGDNTVGQLGRNVTVASAHEPTAAHTPAGVRIESFSVSGWHILAIGDNGTTYAWGAGGSGQLGNGGFAYVLSPVEVNLPEDVEFTAVSAGQGHSVALGDDGKAYSWGLNSNGVLGLGLGLGTFPYEPEPVEIAVPDGVSFVAVAAGGSFTLALDSEGQVYAWGLGSAGRLGHGTEESKDVPTPVALPTGMSFTQISASDIGTGMAVGAQGAYAWGNNQFGQLGDPTGPSRVVSPVRIAPVVVVTGVTFDGVAGTGLSDNGDGTYDVETPAHAAGAVDVVVEWTLGGVPQTSVTYPGGFTYDAPAAPGVVSPPAKRTVIGAFAAGVTRLGGADRYATAIAVSQKFQPNVPAVFVSTGSAFPDALSASAAAALLGGPLLLTPTGSLPDAVAAEISRLNPANIYIVGGSGAVSASVESALSKIAPATRLGGATRYDTGLAIVNMAYEASPLAIIATGNTFPDALAASGAAGVKDAPVILVDGSAATLNSATLAALTRLGVTDVVIVGGSGAVSAGIEQQLQGTYSVTRYGGDTRYDTAALLNKAYFGPGSSATVFVATGRDFPDALAGAALSGGLGAPMFITDPTCVPQAVHEQIEALGASSSVILGGVGVVSPAAAGNTVCVAAG